jgi:hypothetical protein
LKDFRLEANLRQAAAIKLPVDLDSLAVHATVPGATLMPQRLEIWDSPFPDALPREEADFDLRLMRSRP